MLETLSIYLPIFEAWTKLFPATDYAQLTDCIKKTCSEFVAFIVEAILYFRRPPFLNVLRVFFSTSLEGRFSKCEEKIKRQARHLDLQVNTAGLQSSQQRDQGMLKLLETFAPKPSPPPVITFPFRFLQNCVKNDQFFGREDCFQDLDSHFFSNRSKHTGMRSIVLHGLGGCGKSSVAKEYMYRRFERYSVTLWMYADTPGKLDSQYIHLARVLGITTAEGQTRQAILHWMNHLAKPFLLVFDNADDPSVLSPYWPNSVRGSIVITSRNPTTREEGFAQQGLHIKAFDDEQGARYLLNLLPKGYVLTDEDLVAANALSRQFGGLPLALRQAASFMKSKRCPVAQFATIYQRWFNVIDGFNIPGYDKTVADVWTMSSSTLSDHSRDLLDTVALLDPDSIPMELFYITDIRPDYGEFLQDQLSVLSAVEGLANQSLVDYNPHSRCLSLHRFFQDATFRKLSENPRRLRGVVQLAIELIHSFIPEDDFSSVRQPKEWSTIEKCLSHVQSVHSRCLGSISEYGSKLLLKCLTKILNYGYESGQYALGEQAFRNAQELIKQTTNSDHYQQSMLYFYQCRLCSEMVRSWDAVNAIELAKLHLDQAAKERPELLESTFYIRLLSNHGIAYVAVEQYAESEEFHRQAIEHCERLGMEKECSMGNLMQNLGSCYLWSGDLQRAYDILQEALLQPNVNREGAQYTLGNVMLRLKKYDEAIALHKEALRVYLKEIGPNHPTTGDSWHKIGTIFAMPEFPGHDLREAERCFRQALDIAQHPANAQNSDWATFAARAKWKLGSVLDAQGPGVRKEAAGLQAEAMEYLHSVFGKDLPEDKDPNHLFDSLVWYWSR